MYVKIFGSILDSSIWEADSDTRVVWITMLAMADEHGMVYASESGLARRAQLSADKLAAALSVLENPDEDSRDKTNEGRRLERLEGAWQILNYHKYRELRTSKQMADSARQKRYRDAHQRDDSIKADEADEALIRDEDARIASQ